MRLRVLGAASRESEKTARRYDSERPGLGREFAAEVTAVIDEIQRTPTRFGPIVLPHSRRLFRGAKVGKFPYDVIFEERPKEGELRVLAVAHHHRKPGYWRHRR